MQDEAQSDIFAALYQQHANYIYSIALSYLKNPEEAEDAVADVFVQLLESGKSFPDEIQARAWLTVVIRNRCRNILKSWAHRKRDVSSDMESMPAAGQNPELKAVMEAIYRLPERYRLPLMLFAVEGYSIRETAGILHLNESTVRTRIARAREIIRKETGVERA